jgi:glycine/D-amino acid oxidase-like deaminating enzyme
LALCIALSVVTFAAYMATPKQSERSPYSHRSFWELDRYAGPWDYAVIGAGITGLNAALEIKIQEPRSRVLVLEARQTGAVASSRNAGFLCLGSPSEMCALLDAQGETAWLHWTAAKWAGIQRLLRLMGSKSLRYQKVKAYELLTPSGPFRISNFVNEQVLGRIPELNRLLDEALTLSLPFSNQRKRTKSMTLPWSSPYFGEPIFVDQSHGWGAPGLMTLPMAYEGQVHPMFVLDSLKRYAQNLGVVVLQGCPVQGLGPMGLGLQELVMEDQALVIQTKNIILCTNALTNSLIPRPEVIPQRGQVLVSAPLPGGLPKRLMGNFHGDSGYLYFRNLGLDRLLLGGARNLDFQGEQNDQWAENSLLTEHLTHYAYDVLGLNSDELKWEQAWSGTMGFTASGVPHLQALGPGRWLVAGMNGMGMALGPEMGRRVARWAMISGKVDPYSLGLLPKPV